MIETLCYVGFYFPVVFMMLLYCADIAWYFVGLLHGCFVGSHGYDDDNEDGSVDSSMVV